MEHSADVCRPLTVSRRLEVGDKDKSTNIDLYSVAVSESAAHVTLREKAVGEQGEKNEFRER